MSYIKKYPNGFIDRWGNYRRKGSGDSSPVIGKSGPRPELRTLTYGVGINDVMIAEFSSSKIASIEKIYIRREDANYRNILNEADKIYYQALIFKRDDISSKFF